MKISKCIKCNEVIKTDYRLVYLDYKSVLKWFNYSNDIYSNTQFVLCKDCVKGCPNCIKLDEDVSKFSYSTYTSLSSTRTKAVCTKCGKEYMRSMYDIAIRVMLSRGIKLDQGKEKEE